MRERYSNESSGIRRDTRSFEVAIERISGETHDGVFEERVVEMKDHPAHRPINRYLPKTNKIQ